MANRYDVVVIGAGLGGLSAAAFLARSGKKVLLLERHNVPGGYATSFVRGRFEFEVALHELSGIGRDRDGPMCRYLEWLGMADRLEFVEVPTLYRSVFPDMDVSLPSGREAYEAKLASVFPHERDGIHRFLDRVFAVQREIAGLAKAPRRPSPLEIVARFPNAFRVLPRTWSDVLDPLVRDPRARTVLSQYWGYFGLPPSRVNFTYFALGLAGYVSDGAWYVKGRSQALSSAFAERIRELGGDVRLSCGASRIRLRDGRVAGVATEDGQEYACDHVVSNADPITTGRSLVGEDLLPPGWLEGMRVHRVAAGTMNVYLGLDRPPDGLGLTDHENFINPDDDIEAQWQSGQGTGTPSAILASCYNHVWPAISPAGTSMVVLTSLAYGEAWTHVAPERYVETKNRIAEGMLRIAERVAPGLREAAEVIEVATPLTNMRYAATLHGSIYGFDQPPWDSFALRAGHRGGIPGLYFAGAWTQPGGGFEPCIVSGRMAGAQVVKDAGR